MSQPTPRPTLTDVRDQWPAIVGAELARVTYLAGLDAYGVVTVRTVSEAWRRDLAAPGIANAFIRKLPPVIEGQPIRALRFDVRAGKQAGR